MEKKNRVKTGVDLKKYEDSGGVTIGKMHFGLWLSSNRRRIFKGIIIFLIIASAGMLIYSSYSYVFYLLYGRDADKELSNSLAESQLDTQAYREANTPIDLEIGTVNVFSVQGRYDFFIPIKNPNPKHVSNFSYCLRDGAGVDLLCGNSFILPGADKYLVVAGKELERAPGTVKFVITNFAWQRLNAHDIPDWPTYAATRLNFSISNLKYSAPDNSAKNPFHNLSFTLKNNTPYHFSRLPFAIVLWNGSSPTGVNLSAADNFLSSETREIHLSWPSGGERAGRAEVKIDLNILDDSVYLPYRGDSQP